MFFPKFENRIVKIKSLNVPFLKRYQLNSVPKLCLENLWSFLLLRENISNSLWNYRELHGIFMILFSCLIWHKGREVMKRNDKYVFLYGYFTSRTIQRYVFTEWVLKNDGSYRHSFQESTVVMEPWFGVNRWWYGGTVTKKKISCIWRF